MAAVLGMETEKIEAVLSGISGVTIANYNCPGQIVITGRTFAVEQAKAALLEAGARRVLALNVSGPFHSPMLCGAGEALQKELDHVRWRNLEIPYVANVTAETVTEIGQTKTLLAQQVASPVRWEQSIRHMIASGVKTFVEIGPGKTLSGFVKKIDRGVRCFSIQTVEDLESVLSQLQDM